MLFICTRCISTPWIFAFSGFSAMSNLDNQSRYPLRYRGSFSPLMSPTFSEGAPKWSTNFLRCFRTSWHICCVQHNRCSLLLSMSLLSARSSVGGLFGLSIVPKFSDSWGFPKFSEGLLRDCEQPSRKFHSFLLLFSSGDE